MENNKKWSDKLYDWFINSKENNVKIREREEAKLRRSSSLLLLIVFAMIADKENLNNLRNIGSLILIFILYLLIDNYILEAYENLTNKKIREGKK